MIALHNCNYYSTNDGQHIPYFRHRSMTVKRKPVWNVTILPGTSRCLPLAPLASDLACRTAGETRPVATKDSVDMDLWKALTSSRACDGRSPVCSSSMLVSHACKCRVRAIQRQPRHKPIGCVSGVSNYCIFETGVRKYFLARPWKIVLNYRNPSISRAYNFVENSLQLNINFKTTIDHRNFLAQNCTKLST